MANTFTTTIPNGILCLDASKQLLRGKDVDITAAASDMGDDLAGADLFLVDNAAGGSLTSTQYISAANMLNYFLADNSVTLDKMAGGTDGNLISYDGSGDPVAVATGTDGQVLTSTGAGSSPAFEDLPSSTWSISDGTTTNAEFATGESFVYTGGDSITATISGETTSTTTLTIDLNETITVDTINIGDASTSAAKTLWNTCTGAITIGANGGSVVIAGDLQVSGTTITTATETLEIADNTMVLNSDNAGASVDAGFVVQMGSGSDNNPSLWFDATASSADTTGRWVVGSTDDATAAIGGYVADVMQVRIDNAAINTSSSEVPVGHMQYHDGDLYLRVEDS